MRRKLLKNKPLAEAIFELRWDIPESSSGIKKDPHYQLLIGRIYDKVQEEYSFHEPLASSNIPDGFVEYIVQHRFRKSREGWPLIQIGPGIITLNDTDGYVWADFEKRIIALLDTLYISYPNANEELKIRNIKLKYIDAIPFDFDNNDVFVFLKEKMKTQITPYPSLFENTGASSKPSILDLKFSFPCENPHGTINLRFARGKHKQSDAIILETMLYSEADQSPAEKEDIVLWTQKAHELTDDWFFKLIEGELEKNFE